MAAFGIHGKFVEITVVGCSKLKNTEWFRRQDPYVCLEYNTTKFRTRTCTDGGRKAAFQEKFVLTLIEGLREVNVSVFNENTITSDDFIGSGKVQLHKVLSTGFDDSSWPLQSESGRFAGEVRLIMHYSYANRPAARHEPPYGAVPPRGVVPPLSPYGEAPPVQSYGVVRASLPQYSPYPYAPPSQPPYAPPMARPPPNPFRPQQPRAFPPPLPQGVYPQSQYIPPPPSNNPQSLHPPQSSDYPASADPPLHSDYPPSPYPPPSSTHPDPSLYPLQSSTNPDPSTYPHSSHDVEPEPEPTHFDGDYHHDQAY